MKELRIIIAGGRDFNNYNLLHDSVEDIINNKLSEKYTDVDRICIISGTARGADTLGEQYASENNLTLYKFPADWNQYGKRAGFIRNTEMANFAIKDENYGALIAFWDGYSKGTRHMIDIATTRGLDINIIKY